MSVRVLLGAAAVVALPDAAPGQEYVPLPPVTHRAPAAFGGAPAPVRRALAARRCRIPQAAGWGEPHGVVRGEFDGRPGADWAAMCDRPGGSVIVVFWAGRADRADSLAAGGSRGQVLVATPAARIRFFQAGCCVESADSLRRLYRHAGLEVMGTASFSVIYYWTGRRWLELSGAD